MSLIIHHWDQTDGQWDAGFWDSAAPNQNNPMPHQNVSAAFTAQELADLKTAIQALHAMFPSLVTLTDAERKSLQRVGSGRDVFCETAYSGAMSFPEMVPGFVSTTEWGKDESYFAQLGEIEVLLGGVMSKVADTRQAVGAERYRQARKIYEAVKSAKEDVPGLQALYETLSEQFDGQGPNGDDGEASGEGGDDEGGAGGSGGNP